MNSALAAMLGLTLSIILIVKKVSPVYSLILGALIGGLLSGWGLQNTVTEMISGIMEISPAIIRILAAGVLTGMLVKTGAASTISETIIKKLGPKRIYLALALAAMLLERLQRHTDLSGVKTEQEREFTDRYNTLLAQLAGRLEVIDKENRTIITEILNFKKSLSEFKKEVDTTKFEKLANNTLWEMKTQIHYLKQPPIVLRTIVFITVLSILTILATGYLYRDRNEWRGEATYWYKQNDQYKTTQTNKK